VARNCLISVRSVRFACRASAATVSGWLRWARIQSSSGARPASGRPAAGASMYWAAIGLVPGLLIGGSLSDRIGRRRLVLSAVMLSMVAGGVLIAGAHSPGWLFAGRLIMGLASGGAFSAGAAWIKELSAPPYEDAPPGTGARRAGGAMTLGFALGPLVTGVLAQWGPLPAELPYLPQLVLAAGALALAARTWVVLPLAPWVFGSVAVAMVYMPGLVAGRVSDVAVAFAAAGALCTALAGSWSSRWLGSWPAAITPRGRGC
jgi:MFS family permease